MTNKGGRDGAWAGAISLVRFSLSAGVAASAMIPCALAQTQTIAFDIPSQPLASALLTFGRQAGLSIMAPSELVEGRAAPNVRGQLTAADALDRLLAGTGLRPEFVRDNAVRIVAVPRAAADPAPAGSPAGDPDRVVVVGTNIIGAYPASSPVEVFTSEDIARSGAATAGEFVRKLPQNVGTLSPYAAGATTGAPNLDSVSSIDLRGLGFGTTLTLLNGHRMAPSNSGQSVDISLIPTSAIERVEILTDGASAIYGSDAVGGVVNFVLRRDFEGSETRLSYGGVARGGMRRGEASQAVGATWEGGHGLLAYNYALASALKVSDRDYATPAGPGFLSPVEESHSIIAATQQRLSDRLDLDVDLALGRRDVKNASTSIVNVDFPFQSTGTYWSQTEFAQGSATLGYRFDGDLHAQLNATYSSVDVDGERYTLRFNQVPNQLLTTDFSTASSVLDVMGKLDGSLVDLPGGSLRVSIGAGVVDEDYRGIRPVTQIQSASTLGRRSPYAFGELFAPVVGPGQEIPFLRRLELSLAVRYTDYQDRSSPAMARDFGNSTDPKIGLLWSPADGLNLRATYGTSFRAPALTQLDSTATGNALLPAILGGSPGLVLNLGPYAAPDLGPETAETFTGGFDVSFPGLKGFSLSATYYNIDYQGRIAIAPAGSIDVFGFPQLVPELIYKAPSAAFIADQLTSAPLIFNATAIDLADPVAAAQTLFMTPNFWIFDTRYKNLALSRQDGIDMAVNQSLRTDWGDLNLAANVTRILSDRQQASATSTVMTGVGIPARPPHWRGRLSASLSHRGFNATLGANYVDSYVNTWAAGTPQVEDWTTIDLTLNHNFQSGLLEGLRLSAGIQNLFDRDPPTLNMGSGNAIVSPVGFDPVNANPMGRLYALSVTKTW